MLLKPVFCLFYADNLQPVCRFYKEFVIIEEAPIAVKGVR